jgi:3-polyprenyl-4-hydroxybenzoate decarboxylase
MTANLSASAPHIDPVRRVDRVDTQRFRLRRFLDTLAREGELIFHDDRVELIEVAHHLENTVQAVAFRNIGAKRDQLVGNVMASRKRLALALDVDENELLAELRRRLARPIPLSKSHRTKRLSMPLSGRARTPTLQGSLSTSNTH